MVQMDLLPAVHSILSNHPQWPPRIEDQALQRGSAGRLPVTHAFHHSNGCVAQVVHQSNQGWLRKMEPQEIRFQCSLYADDAILFIRPSVQEASAVKEILRIFGDATGLKTNLAKCSITPIFGGEDALQDIISILGCQVQQFPIKYLGLPLSTKKIPKAEFQTVVEAVARKLPPCHGSLMERSGRLV